MGIGLKNFWEWFLFLVAVEKFVFDFSLFVELLYFNAISEIWPHCFFHVLIILFACLCGDSGMLSWSTKL